MKHVPYALGKSVSEAIPSWGLSMSQGIPTAKSSHLGLEGYGPRSYLSNTVNSDINRFILYEIFTVDTSDQFT